MANYLVLISVMAMACTQVMAFEPSPLQDFCVADTSSSITVNGHACLDSKKVEAKHFSFSGLHIAGDTSNPLGSAFTRVFVDVLPGLNTLGISVVRIDMEPWGLVAPHMHPRASEIVTVLEGNVFVGFVTSNPENRLITKTLKKGDVFAFPIGLVHFQQNVGNSNAVTLVFFSSQNPGIIAVPPSVFGSNPSIAVDILAKTFQVNKDVVNQIQDKF
ncbi:putative germin-like protein 2-3 [Tripterygium wilfordii]|uniref:putative germin-like protein 2-3 n=1 Tax=Tripterygium wilfordii TaxID=458696 RepID=UPI0018F80EC9|nr:putative germin-like protein 2-3 [Tripterygium wilfordii]